MAASQMTRRNFAKVMRLHVLLLVLNVNGCISLRSSSNWRCSRHGMIRRYPWRADGAVSVKFCQEKLHQHDVDDELTTITAMTTHDFRISPPSLSIIIPAYNEESRIGKTLSRYQTFLSSSKFWQHQSDIWVIDDGSTDRTSAAVNEIANCYLNATTGDGDGNIHDFANRAIPIHCLMMDTNQGKGAAVARGMLELATVTAFHHQPRIVLVADADASGDISCLNGMWFELSKVLTMHMPTITPPINDNNTDVDTAVSLLDAALVVGKRQSPDISLLRWWLRVGFRATVRMACGDLGVTDTQCGFKLMTLTAGKRLYRDLHLSRWTHDVEVLMRARDWKIPVSEHPVPWNDQEGSKLVQPSKLLELVGIIWLMLWQVLRLRWEYDVTGNWKTTNIRDD